MVNKLTIEIDAKTKVQEIVDKINKAFGNLDKTAKKTGRDNGLDNFAKSGLAVEQSINGVASAIDALMPSMASITSIATIGGLAAIAYQWATLGTKLTVMADDAGVSARELQLVGGAADMAGVDADAAEQSYAQLGQTLHDTLYGRNTTAVIFLRSLGVEIRRNKAGVVDLRATFLDFAEALSKYKDPHVQRRFAAGLGVEALLPLMRLGRAGILKLEQEYAKTHAPIDADAAAAADRRRKQFGNIMLGIGQSAVESVGQTDLNNMSQTAQRWRKSFQWLGDLFSEPAPTTPAPTTPAAAARPSATTIPDRWRTMMLETDRQLGLRAGSTASQIGVESMFDPKAVSRAGAMGLAQIMPKTLADMQRRFGRQMNPFSPQDALLMNREIMRENLAQFGNYPDALRAYNNGWDRRRWNNHETAAYPGKVLAGIRSAPSPRPMAWLDDVLNAPTASRLDISALQAANSATLATRTGQQVVGGAGGHGMPVEGRVEVAFKNAPHGMTASVTRERGIGIEPRIDYSLPEGLAP